MLSGSRFGRVAAVVSWQQKIIVSRFLLLRSSPSHSRPPSLCTPRFFNPVCPIFRIRFSFNSSRSSSPDHSCSSFNSSRLQQRKGSGRWKHSVNSFSVNSAPSFSTRLNTGGASHYGAPSALSSLPFSRSVILRRSGMGQQQQEQHRRNGRNRRRRQKENTVLVEAIASIDDPETDVNRDNSLQEDLQRYGVHESDYNCHKVEPEDQKLSQGMSTRGSSSMTRKRKATVGYSSDSKQQDTPPNGKSTVVQDWCCYLLYSVNSKKTYVGVTCDIGRRLRQHNGEISGGAKSARTGRPWRLVCTVHGFNSRSEACQFEWKWKSTAAKYRIIVRQHSETVESPLITRRRATLAKILKVKEEWVYLNVQWHAD